MRPSHSKSNLERSAASKDQRMWEWKTDQLVALLNGQKEVKEESIQQTELLIYFSTNICRKQRWMVQYVNCFFASDYSFKKLIITSFQSVILLVLMHYDRVILEVTPFGWQQIQSKSQTSLFWLNSLMIVWFMARANFGTARAALKIENRFESV